MRNRFAFTTSYHTQFPEYVRARAPIPLALSYAHLRRFHSAAARTMVATPTLQRQLELRGFRNIVRWTRGVEWSCSSPAQGFPGLAAADLVYLGRVAVEKNIEAFLESICPARSSSSATARRRSLQAEFSTAKFVGFKFGAELAAHLAAADVFVFPSRTDTFGLVLLEAMACGVPVAAYPVTGPIDVIENGTTGMLDEDLRAAALAALKLDPAKCRRFALAHTWEAATRQFLGNLAPREILEGSG